MLGINGLRIQYVGTFIQVREILKKNCLFAYSLTHLCLASHKRTLAKRMDPDKAQRSVDLEKTPPNDD